MKLSFVPLVALALFVTPNVGQSADKPAQKPAVESAAKKDLPKYLLQYRFREGEEIRAKVTHLATIETTIAGSTQKTEMTSYSTKLWRVVRVDPAGTMTFEHLVENVDMRNQMSGRQEVRYNSLTDSAAPLGYEDVAKSIGKVLSAVTISPSGNVLKREEKQVRSVADNSGSVLLPKLPDEPEPIGQVWSLPVEVNVALDDGASKAIQTRQRYELENVEGGVATIAVETQILTPVSNPKIRVQLIQRLSKGHIRFDLDAGRILSQRTDLDERVLGFSGGDSSMHYVARFTEELLPATPKTAAIK
ncbi:MAG TPA: hypothetical protein VGY55_05720 [Pirellulales bacterium]|jgi:hypothetical protein|nr:hypothetical protein [Pirellulales bacterium]